MFICYIGGLMDFLWWLLDFLMVIWGAIPKWVNSKAARAPSDRFNLYSGVSAVKLVILGTRYFNVFFTQDGRPLLSQQLHKGQITSLSYTSPIKLSSKTIHQVCVLHTYCVILFTLHGNVVAGSDLTMVHSLCVVFYPGWAVGYM